MKGPPKVDPKSTSAPGPMFRKKGMYSMSTMSSTPPTIMRAFRHQAPKKPLHPGA